MVKIFEYFDLLTYLKDEFHFRQSNNPQYSLRAMAEKLGLNSGTVVRIMNGNRNISKNLFPVFVTYLKLDSDETEYFYHLIQFNQAKSEELRDKSYRMLVSMKNSRIKQVKEIDYAFYEEWYYTAIRELLRVYQFDGDYKALGSQLEPPITAHEAKRAVALLEKLGMITRDNDGYHVSDASISSGALWKNTAIKQYQKSMAQKAVDALETVDIDERDFSTMTMCYSEKGFGRIKELIKHTRQELSRIEETDSGRNRVYHINLQLFPLSKAVNKE